MKDDPLREHLTRLLRGGSAHIEVETALRGFPSSRAATAVPAYPHTPWQLLEHIRIAQWDILEFALDPDHVSPKFPDGYWPDSDAPPDEDAWKGSVNDICRDLESMIALVKDRATDLLAPIPHGEGQTVLREAMLVADHNAYHLGQLMMLRRALS